MYIQTYAHYDIFATNRTIDNYFLQLSYEYNRITTFYLVTAAHCTDGCVDVTCTKSLHLRFKYNVVCEM